MLQFVFTIKSTTYNKVIHVPCEQAFKSSLLYSGLGGPDTASNHQANCFDAHKSAGAIPNKTEKAKAYF
jgi:hypothetical protein